MTRPGHDARTKRSQADAGGPGDHARDIEEGVGNRGHHEQGQHAVAGHPAAEACIALHVAQRALAGPAHVIPAEFADHLAGGAHQAHRPDVVQRRGKGATLTAAGAGRIRVAAPTAVSRKTAAYPAPASRSRSRSAKTTARIAMAKTPSRPTTCAARRQRERGAEAAAWGVTAITEPAGSGFSWLIRRSRDRAARSLERTGLPGRRARDEMGLWPSVDG